MPNAQNTTSPLGCGALKLLKILKKCCKTSHALYKYKYSMNQRILISITQPPWTRNGCFILNGHFLTNVTLPSRYRHRMGNPSYQNHSAGPKQGVNVIPTFPYGNVSIQQSLYVNAAMQSPHSAVPTTSRSMLKIDEFGRSWFKFYSHNYSAQYILPAFACILYCISELCLVIVMFLCLCLSFWCFSFFFFFLGGGKCI